MADDTPRIPRHKERPVSDGDMDAICDAALDEPAIDADEEMIRGGPEGFAESMALMRGRTRRLAAGVPHVSDVLSARRKRSFLMALSQTGNVAAACAAAGWSRSVPYGIRKADQDFAEKWDFALENATDVLHGAAFQRAVHGVSKDVWKGSKEGPVNVGQETVYSDTLLMFLLKAHDRARFGDRPDADKGSGDGGGVLVVPGKMPLDEWSAAAALQQAKYRERQEDPE